MSGMCVDTRKIKTENEKGAAIVNLPRVMKLIFSKVNLEALDALTKPRRVDFKGKDCKHAVSNMK